MEEVSREEWKDIFDKVNARVINRSNRVGLIEPRSWANDAKQAK